MMWYQNNYRRHLCDMHIADWDQTFLSQFSPEDYVENLKIANIQNAMLYLQSHAGLCYYPTKIGVMHRAFCGKENQMLRTAELCHKNGIQVTGYYSLNYNTAEHDRHPAWRMLQKNHRSKRENSQCGAVDEKSLPFASPQSGRYGLCCPNNEEYRSFVFRQIDEMLSYFDLDGMFFDMPFWPHTCFCDSCRKRWEQETSLPFPTQDARDESPIHLTLMQKKYQWMGEWAQAVSNYVKKKAPFLSVEHNFASAIAGTSDNGCGTEVNKASDFVGGDLYGGIFNHSLACKFYQNITKQMPFDYMFSRCKPTLRSHTLTKSEDEMLTEVLLTTAHHGATLVIDAIDPVGTLDRRVYQRVGKVFEAEKTYEPYLKGKMKEDIGLYYPLRSRFGKNLRGFDSMDGCIGASKALIGAHIPFGVTGSFHSLKEYCAIVIPMASEQEEDTERILDYIREGGAVYFSGARNSALLLALTGGTTKGYTEEKTVYLSPQEGMEALFGGFHAAYPLPMDIQAPQVEGISNARVLATLTLPYTKPKESRFASIHSDPPGITTDFPMVVEGAYGKGRFLWSAIPLEAVDMEEYRCIFLRLLQALQDNKPLSFFSNAPEDVEITLYEDNDCLYLNLIHLQERIAAPTLSSFEVAVRCEEPIKAVEYLPSGTSLAFEQKDGYVHLKTEPLHVFSMYRIRK